MSAEPLPIFTLPLFPLHHVQFPLVPLQLYIFEERYKAMINGCIERNEPFGVTLIREGFEVGAPATPFDIGCVARILAVQREDDGRMRLLAAGESRFRLLDYMEADLPYLIGKVETVEDAPASQEALEPLVVILKQTFTRYLRVLAEQAGESLPLLEMPADAALLAYYIASIANLEPMVKQELLEMTDARQRMETEIALLDAQIAEIETLRDQEASAELEGTELDNPVLFAAPLDLNSAAVSQYRQEGRN